MASDTNGAPKNPCFVCHTHADPPNYVDDARFQIAWLLPPAAHDNPWTNLFSPPVLRARPTTDDEILAYVRKSNYFDDEGKIALASRLAEVPATWDLDHDGRWGGYVPDVWLRFDDAGFDLRPDGSKSGWRAFAYAPFPGTFFPTNGSMDDVLIRLDPMLQEDASGRPDERLYAINLSIVESLIKRVDIPIAATDERALGVDLDLDGTLGTATHVAFDPGDGKGATRMRYVGKGRDLGRAFPISPGLFPVRTEFVHTVRYLDVAPDGHVAMAPRMKELRYAKKVHWLGYEALKGKMDAETVEQADSRDGTLPIFSERERGVSNDQGWLYQAFIEDAQGALRPQTFEEIVSCVGCHGGIGATTDGNFSFARKLASAPSSGGKGAMDGWFHWSRRDLRGIPEPKRRDGTFEYTRYLTENGAGDELRENEEVLARFFAADGSLRSSAATALHADIATLLLPSAARAVALDRAYKAIVDEQSFTKGRDAVLSPAIHVYAQPPIGRQTGVSVAIEGR
jgi:hypothetical protein